MATPTAPLPDARTCEQARLSRDARFDGLFFTAVTSTRIYCRPVCPAPSPKPQNVRYYASAAAAEAAGFRPCLRCRPELSPGNDAWQRGDFATVQRTNDRLAPLHDAMFCEASPGPVKYATSLLGKTTAETRLPLCEIASESKERVAEAMRGAGLLN